MSQLNDRGQRGQPDRRDGIAQRHHMGYVPAEHTNSEHQVRIARLLVIGVIAVLEDWLFALLKRVLFPYTTVAERG